MSRQPLGGYSKNPHILEVMRSQTLKKKREREIKKVKIKAEI